MSNELQLRHRIALLATIAGALIAACSGDTPADRAADAGTDVSQPTTGGTSGGGSGGASGGTGGMAGRGSGASAGSGIGGTLVTRDAPAFDGACEISCFQPGGQYCGRIGEICRRGYIDCPPCVQEGYTCGGSGTPGLCGTTPDSGHCTPTECKQPGGQYCGHIGGGCGDTIDCGGCPPGFICGGGGVPGLCAIPIVDCRPTVCQQPLGQYCGVVGDGCGRALDCGSCPSGQSCGERSAHVCNDPCPLCASIARCEGGSTTVSGTAVTASAMNPHPVSGAIVYIPNLAPGAKVPRLSDGPACSRCAPHSANDVLSAAVTEADGHFTLRDVPAGQGIPIVVQLGGWQMQTAIDVMPCTENALPAGTVRLPRNQLEGDIPLTAIATGNHDGIECLLRKMGIDDAEFTNPSQPGRMHLYRSNGATIDGATPDRAVLEGATIGGGNWQRYSQVLLPCTGSEMLESEAALRNFSDYLNRGGRVLATHFSYAWLFHNGGFGDVGTWTPNAVGPTAPLATDVVTSSSRGMEFARWLGGVGALSRPSPPQMQIAAPHGDLGSLAPGKGALLWLSSFSPATSQAISIDTPILAPPASTCGRVVFSDFHTTGAPTDDAAFPAECGPDMTFSADEKALEFMLLALFSCEDAKLDPALPEPPPAPPDPPPYPPPPPPPPPN